MIFGLPNKSTTTERIIAFERQRSIRLPEDYKAFLLEFNGGYLDRSNDYFEVENWNSFCVDNLLGITDDPSTSITTRRFTNFSDGVRDKFLQIGFASGEILLMDLREGNTHGQIYIRAHDSVPNDPILIDGTGFADGDYEEAALLHPVATSFSGFLSMLGPEPD